MSRIGRMPVEVPAGVTVTVDGQRVAAKGPKGELELHVRTPIEVGWQGEPGSTIVVTRPTDEKEHRALHGLSRALIANIVEGVSQGFSKTLEIVGVGYRAQAKGKGIELRLGFSHNIEFPAPDGIRLETPNPTTIVVSGADKQQVGHTAAVIRVVQATGAVQGQRNPIPG